MLATLVDAPFHLAGWVYEEKYDGIRIIAYKEGSKVTLLTRNTKDRTADFPGVVAAVAALPAPTLALDGEVVALDAQGVSRFQMLQGRGGGDETTDSSERSATRIRYAVFDCLFASGRDLRAAPLHERRAVLEAELPEGAVLTWARRLADDGFAAFADAKARGLEGLVGKDSTSPYRDGQRSLAWRKVKVRAEEEFVIGGFTTPAGARTHFGALLVGAWERGRLRYAGKVGTGFDAETLADLSRRFTSLVRSTPPFQDPPRERGVTWVEPQLVAQIAFTEMTRDGRLRHPAFLGLRHDKAPEEVRSPRAVSSSRPLTRRSAVEGPPARDAATARARGRVRLPPPRSRRPAPGP
jgi:bifunctional non-homologous end joining protein LigD